MFTVFIGITAQCFGQRILYDSDNGSREYGIPSKNYYIDLSTIKTEGRYKSVWLIKDVQLTKNEYNKYEHNNYEKYPSKAQKYIIDCTGRVRVALVASYTYSEGMAKGKVEESKVWESAEWEPIISYNSRKFTDVIEERVCTVKRNLPDNETKEIKRQNCINLGLAPWSAEFERCMK